MNVRIVLKAFARRIVRDVEELGAEIALIADSMLVIAGVPDVSGTLLAGCEGIATFDELNASGRADVDCWCDEDVDMVGHDGESV
jgi:hypothetical protein